MDLGYRGLLTASEWKCDSGRNLTADKVSHSLQTISPLEWLGKLLGAFQKHGSPHTSLAFEPCGGQPVPYSLEYLAQWLAHSRHLELLE